MPAVYVLEGGYSNSSGEDSGYVFLLWLIYALPYVASGIALLITKEPVMGFWTALPSALVDSVMVPFVFVAARSDGLAVVPLLLFQPVKALLLIPLGVYVGLRKYMYQDPQ